MPNYFIESCGCMIRSMTGFGRELEHFDNCDILVEIKSVNHRYYEFSAKLPRIYGYLEDKLKTMLNGKIARGKVEVSVSVLNSKGATEKIEVNLEVAKGYVDALAEANTILHINNDLSLSHLIGLSDVFTVNKIIEDEQDVTDRIMPIANRALEKFISMREIEGEKMKADVLSRLDYIEKAVDFVEKKSPLVTKAYEKRLYDRLKEVLEDKNIDEQRIVTEAAIFADKTAVDEETVRLRSHISQFKELLESDIAVGRKLDFLVQEINREVNTIGSKAQDLEITKTVVDLKSEIEKIREQIQNIE